jgi:hypothetical protein
MNDLLECRPSFPMGISIVKGVKSIETTLTVFEDPVEIKFSPCACGTSR